MIEKRKYPAIARQTWTNIFFMHWRVDSESLQQYIKRPYELDIFDDSAWVSVVCFVAKNSQLRLLPFDFVSSAIQTNVRTYVTMPHERERGVYFLKLLLNNRFAVTSAQLGINLPFQYVNALVTDQDGIITFKSERENETKIHVEFCTTKRRDESELAHFLTERYAIWHHKRNRLIKVPITHPKWWINRAEATIFTNNIHPLIEGRRPDYVHAGDEKITHLYPYETAGLFL